MKIKNLSENYRKKKFESVRLLRTLSNFKILLNFQEGFNQDNRVTSRICVSIVMQPL
jgi:hypothetical protein